MWDKIKAFFANKTVIIVEAVLIALAAGGLLEAGIKSETIVKIPELVAAVIAAIVAIVTFIEGLVKTDNTTSFYEKVNNGIKDFFKKKWVIITEAVIIALASAGLVIGGLQAPMVVGKIVGLTAGVIIAVEAIVTFIQGLKA